jgi:hypothetical protein
MQLRAAAGLLSARLRATACTRDGSPASDASSNVVRSLMFKASDQITVTTTLDKPDKADGPSGVVLSDINGLRHKTRPKPLCPGGS